MKELIKMFAAVRSGIGEVGNVGVGSSDFENTFTNILNGIIGALAMVAVVVIIMGGVTYMTSGGDAGKVKKGKDTILYGLIGLIVCALAAALVNFVIRNVINNA